MDVRLSLKAARKASADKIRKKLALSYPLSTATQLVAPLGETTVEVEVYTGHSIPNALKTWIFDLFERNMKAMYEASEDGYDPVEKRKELFDPESRFILLRPSAEASPIAFTIFRFDTEGIAEEDMEEVVYCYEVQVEAAERSRGAGKLLMELLLQTCTDWKMEKVILTYFKANRTALRFYQRLGYTVDAISPSAMGEDEEEYEILSLKRG